jgi:hypothetical protein
MDGFPEYSTPLTEHWQNRPNASTPFLAMGDTLVLSHGLSDSSVTTPCRPAVRATAAPRSYPNSSTQLTFRTLSDGDPRIFPGAF